jgi:DNA-directed RNA polymerase specialized sigma24 family protein
MLRELYDECVRFAAASSRNAHEARDLAHAVLLDAIEREVTDLGAVERRAWLRGALRKHAAFEARTAGRRRAREARWHAALEADASPAPEPWRFTPELLAQLSPALRVLAALAAAELEPREIRSVLRLSDTAFRKRLSELRRAVREATAAGIAVVCRPPSAYALGAARAELLMGLKSQPRTWAVASHDPDGHPLIFSRADAHGSQPDGNSQPKES